MTILVFGILLLFVLMAALGYVLGYHDGKWDERDNNKSRVAGESCD